MTNDLPSEAYFAWWAYFIEHGKLAPAKRAQAEHDAVMSKVNRALR